MNDSGFKEPTNTAVITTKKIIEGKGWIGYVTHDSDDGGWQFLESQGSSHTEEAAVVSLEEITRIDPTTLELINLPLGWCAWRKSKESSWEKEPST